MTVLDSTLHDVSVKFKFFAGDNTDSSRIIESPESTEYSFILDDEIVLFQNYSRSIAAYQPFEAPFMAKIITPNFKTEYLTLKVVISEFSGSSVSDMNKFSKRYLSGNACNIFGDIDPSDDTNSAWHGDICTVWRTSAPNKSPLALNVVFDQL